MGILKMANKTLVERDSIREQLGRLGMDVIFPEEKTPKGQKVKAKKQAKPKNNKGKEGFILMILVTSMKTDY